MYTASEAISRMKWHRLFLSFLLVTASTILLLQCHLTTGVSRGLLRRNMPSHIKYILVWTNPTRDPIKYLGIGQTTFFERNCAVTNCFVSSDRGFFDHVTDFDVIIYHAPEFVHDPFDLPESRAPHQLYVFASMESSDYYRVCNERFNTYFNRTWTYKLKSDAYFGYIIIKNKEGQVIGPKQTMHWKNIKEMKPIDKTLETKLKSKKYAAAWFVSNCNTPSKREKVARTLQQELEKYGLTLDIYGKCGTKKCLTNVMDECFKMVERDYYFYLSFENSFSEDYVTEKLLRPLLYYTVPIVYGGANYTRFMPDGIYLNANKTDIPELAKQMDFIIKHKEEYYNFFKWHNYYSYHDIVESPDTDPYCKVCAMINDQTHTDMNTVNDNFTGWWNPPGQCKQSSASNTIRSMGNWGHLITILVSCLYFFQF